MTPVFENGPEPMAAKKTAAKKTPARKSLAKAAKVVHAKPERTYAPLVNLGQFSEEELADLMVGAGDAPRRKTYFDIEERAPFSKDGSKVYLEMTKTATMFDYRALDARRANRTMLTVPPKLREQLRDVMGKGEEEGDYLLTTSIIALATWACQELKRSKRRIVVSGAVDDLEPVRKQVRKAIVAKGRKKR
ncbi:hypothetical protein [Stenotrophomonas maltophilia]|uniref:hypothetical protein n=1 Tax=Stenotrophomonas maltophilia TaxID=40324 RepID=UPI00209B5467|nr:hypothetical protein [Stenotrophomonas maltophilia]MCO7473051.1 hypothetical protein [Stenotrophomonas maltophilia]